MFRRILLASLGLITLVIPTVDAADGIRRGVPADTYLVIYQRHNPERDYQRQYYADVWATVKQTRILERMLELIQKRVSPDDYDKAAAVIEELRQATEPIPWSELAAAEESVYAQSMDVEPFPISQHLFMLQTTARHAQAAVTGLENLMRMAVKYAGPDAPPGFGVEKSETDGKVTVTLRLPGESPFHPTAVAAGDVLIVASTDEMARQALDLLESSETGKSKFDDPRLQQALAKLPEAEDAVVFYDGKLQFERLRGLKQFILRLGGVEPGENPDSEAVVAARVVGDVLDQLAVLDYEVTVGYTEKFQNRTQSYGRLLPGSEDKVLTRMFSQGAPFEDWGRWVPADATSYSLSTGVNLHVFYEWLTGYLRTEFPSTSEGLEQFEALQQLYDFHLDKDLFQSFSGESVMVSFPSSTPSPFGQTNDSVMFLRCHNQERIQALLDRLMDMIGQADWAQAQNLKLVESGQLEGFQEVSAQMLMLLGIKPVIGFHEGWMVIGSSAGAVQAVLDTRAGDRPSITGTRAFQQFGMEIEGPVRTVSYTNLAASIRGAAQALQQFGTMLPMIMGMAGAGQQQMQELEPVIEFFGLLPSIGQIVGKFDFFEAQLNVIQDGDEPGTYVKRSVVLIRPPARK